MPLPGITKDEKGGARTREMQPGSRDNTYLSAQYHRIDARRGGNRAAVAVAHTILVTAYYMLRNGTPYQDLGEAYFDERDKQATVRRTVQRLERLGYRVTLESGSSVA